MARVHLPPDVMREPTHLLIIDPQNDFCDLPESARPAGAVPALPVEGADADMRRLAGLIRAAGDRLDEITVTVDNHQRLDIAHPPFWQRADGGAVAPFTEIPAARMRAGEFVQRDPSARERTLAYLDALEAGGRYTLMIWPVHCETGTWGQRVHAELQAACETWAANRVATAFETVAKGANPWTEHYSAVLAEVPDPDDPATQLNRPLLERLDRAGEIVIAGEAGSHCVRATTEHIVAHLPGDRPERITLLTDCMSPVAGFAARQGDFFEAMRARGVELMTSVEWLRRHAPGGTA